MEIKKVLKYVSLAGAVLAAGAAIGVAVKLLKEKLEEEKPQSLICCASYTRMASEGAL